MRALQLVLVITPGDVLRMDQFKREIAGALRSTIEAHGPIKERDIGSATKRISAALREAIKRERDQLMKTEPRAQGDKAVSGRP